MPEDYSRARALATVEHLGETFRVVRRRFDGKHWRGYLALVHGAALMSHGTYPDTTDPGEAAAFFKSLLVRTFKDRESLQRAIRETKERGDHARY